MLALLLALAAPARAADVIFPEATPVSLDDFSVAYLVYDMVLGEVAQGMYVVEDGDTIRKWAGPDADGCFDNDACPGNLWARTDARLALVMAVGAEGDRTRITVKFFAWDRAEPLRVVEDSIPQGTEVAFAKNLAFTTAEVLSEVSPRAAEAPEPKPAPAPREVTPREPVVDLDEPEEPRSRAAREPEEEEERPSSSRPPSRPTSARAAAEAEADRRALGVGKRGYAAWKASGDDIDTWRRDHRVRAGRVHLEAGGGYAMGNTDRGYGVWVQLDTVEGTLETTAASTWEGAGEGGGGTGWAGLGYSPTWFLEVAAQAGVVQGRKYLEAGWECDDCTPASDEVPFDPVVGTQLWVSPRLRVHVIPTGFIKPYLLGGLDLSFYDGFVAETTNISFPAAQGGFAYGVAFGGGVAVDAAPDLSLFAEVPYSLTMSPVWRSYDDPAVATQPAGLTSGAGVLRIVGGVTVHLGGRR